MNKVSKHFRLSQGVLRMIDDIASLYSSPFAKVTATQVVEQAIQRLYVETIGKDGKKDS